MSFILDALKKSENERQRTIGPSLADAPTHAPQAERPWWALVVAGLLVGNLAVLMYVLLRDEAPPPVASPAPAPVVYSPPAPVTTRPVKPSSDPSVRSLAEEANASMAPAYEEPVYSQRDSYASAEAYPGSIDPVPAAQSAPQPREATEVLPTASALIASGTSLPELRLDFHVYSTNPADRFIFVNMRKYGEGQALQEGPTVERITADGAVLNHQGLRFLLPRQ